MKEISLDDVVPGTLFLILIGLLVFAGMKCSTTPVIQDPDYSPVIEDSRDFVKRTENQRRGENYALNDCQGDLAKALNKVGQLSNTLETCDEQKRKNAKLYAECYKDLNKARLSLASGFKHKFYIGFFSMVAGVVLGFAGPRAIKFLVKGGV